MTKNVLGFISTKLTQAGINYEYGEWNSPVRYPYFVGTYNEYEPTEEDGLHEVDFTLDGFSSGSWITLENARETIERAFYDCTAILDNGSGVDISYGGALIVPTGDAELKRIQITLKIKEWKVNI